MAEKFSIAEAHGAARAMFFIGGFGTASWAPLVPYLKERLAVEEDVLGLLLLCIGVGSILTMPIAGALTQRFGCRRVIFVAVPAFILMLLAITQVGAIWSAALALLFFGAFTGAMDVAVNIQAVLVEQAAKRRLMSGMHALWSVGDFVGAGLFGLWVGVLGLHPFLSTVIAAALMGAILLRYQRPLLRRGGEKGRMVAMPRGIIVFVGIVAFISFLVEGAVMDWGAVFLVTERNFEISFAGTGFMVFSLAMLFMRLMGDAIVQKIGAKTVVLSGSLIAFSGFLLIIFAEGNFLMLSGFFFVGIGIANIVPVFFSLVGRQKAMPVAEAMAAVSMLGYLGLLTGPAGLGFLAQATSLFFSFAALAFLVILQMMVSIYVYRRIL